MSPRNARRKSAAIKAEVFRLKEEGKSNAEIGRELGLSRQYVSYLLTSDIWRSGKEVQASISQLERQGEYGLAEMLRVMKQRRTKNK